MFNTYPTWLQNNTGAIARNIVQSLADYFGIPFVNAGPVHKGTVVTNSGGLNVRSMPSTNSTIVGYLPQGTVVTIYGKTGDWYVIRYGNMSGYANAEFIEYSPYY